MKSIILFTILFFLASCSTIQPNKQNEEKESKLPEPIITEAVSTIGFSKIINSFVNEVVTEWQEIHSVTPLRIVVHELDTNTDQIFSSEVKALVEESLSARLEISILERSDIDKIFLEQSFEANNFFSMADMKPLKLAEADAVVYGLLSDTGAESVSLTLSCVEFETARILARKKFEIPHDFLCIS